MSKRPEGVTSWESQGPVVDSTLIGFYSESGIKHCRLLNRRVTWFYLDA